MPSYRVFFIDDEEDSIKSYMDFLGLYKEDGAEIHVASSNSIREASLKLEGRASEYDALVLDMQMPWPSDAPRDEQEKFVYAGLRFLSNHLGAILDARLPVFILTNMQIGDIQKVIDEHISKLPDMLYEIGRKGQPAAVDFPEVLLALVNRNRVA